MKKKKSKAIIDYDTTDVTSFIDPLKKLKLIDIGFALPDQKSSKVVSVRMPTQLVNALQSIGHRRDIPYQSLIKLYLWERVEKELKRSA